MPTLRQWFIFFYASTVMTLFIVAIIIAIQTNSVAENWNVHRCNPVFMLFSGDVEKNFTDCVQNIQTSMMGQALQPITWSMYNLSNVSSLIVDGLNDTRQMFDTTRNFITQIVQLVFGTLLNLVVEFQKITLKISDIGAKIVGTMTGLLFILDGTNKTMLSAWNGPPGQLTRKIGSCFTLSQTINGILITDYKKGDKIGDSIICNIIFIEQDGEEKLYEYEDIVVSGSHCVLYKNEWIRIDKHKNSKYIRNTYDGEKLICFITSNGKIQIKNIIFGDYNRIA
jgi:hypothetical protein